ncbi:MAG: hypothetical protein AAF743_01645 [Planctomycetota bacterium]
MRTALLATLALTTPAFATFAPSEVFDLDLFVGNEDGGDLFIEGAFPFGSIVTISDTGFGGFEVFSSETLDGGVATTVIGVNATGGGTIPLPGYTAEGSPATDFLFALGSLSPLGDGLDFDKPSDVLSVEGFAIIDGLPDPAGPFTAGAIEFGVAPDGSEVRVDFGLGTSGVDLADEAITGIFIEITSVEIPEPTGLAGLTLGGLLLHRRR